MKYTIVQSGCNAMDGGSRSVDANCFNKFNRRRLVRFNFRAFERDARRASVSRNDYFSELLCRIKSAVHLTFAEKTIHVCVHESEQQSLLFRDSGKATIVPAESLQRAIQTEFLNMDRVSRVQRTPRAFKHMVIHGK